jgi:hypothetical protein
MHTHTHTHTHTQCMYVCMYIRMYIRMYIYIYIYIYMVCIYVQVRRYEFDFAAASRAAASQIFASADNPARSTRSPLYAGVRDSSSSPSGVRDSSSAADTARNTSSSGYSGVRDSSSSPCGVRDSSSSAFRPASSSSLPLSLLSAFSESGDELRQVSFLSLSLSLSLSLYICVCECVYLLYKYIYYINIYTTHALQRVSPPVWRESSRLNLLFLFLFFLLHIWATAASTLDLSL